ncbi:furin-like protease kpc-1 [Hydra vulgaris]|uniref:Furin-like protease kpc-1 n=1 Tax=Hydra vulgaris TaxID=6087 RepID=A0ABM4DN04_HYDVU
MNSHLAIFFILQFLLCTWIKQVLTSDKIYTNTWAVNILGGEQAARELADLHNFDYRGPVGSLPDLYIFSHKNIKARSKRSADEHQSLLTTHPNIIWAEQQIAKSRRRRGYEVISDPLFDKQWYLKNKGQTRERCKSQYAGDNFEQLDINVVKAWNLNVTGAGVVVSILDDGLEHSHPDLSRNYDSLASYDFNSGDSDPAPRYSQDNINKHGTRCAGEVAAEINNNICGAGVAFNAKVGGIRMLDGDVTDAVEAGSLSYKPEHIDIYSSSWGPDDDGTTVDGPGQLALNAFKAGIEKGRGGLGSIFVWATGNGGRFQDYCSCDGYINSPYTISIGAVDNCGMKPWYSEACSGTLAVTYSSGDASGQFDKQIATTDLHGTCTQSHTGTSAAAPLAAGIFALVLEANKKLTWRDMQHLIVKTSKMVSPKDDEWQKNAAGYYVNPKFGFGALDTGGLVEMASRKDWKTAGTQHMCHTIKNDVNEFSAASTDSYIEASGCENDKGSCVTKLEHVHVVINLKKNRQRGQLSISLTSPHGTVSKILQKRPRDNSEEGFKNWAFLTVFHWGESPKGKWKLSINDQTKEGFTLVSWYMTFYGTCDNKISDPFKIQINESEICDKICKKGCPEVFFDSCELCEQYCDCTIGRCVKQCANDLITDNQLHLCKRSLEYQEEHTLNNLVARELKEQPVIGISMTAKFAIIFLALLAISAMVSGIAFFIANMPQSKTFAQGYRSVSRYPCTDTVEEGLIVDEDKSSLNSLETKIVKS